jgi:hypothetical protein
MAQNIIRVVILILLSIGSFFAPASRATMLARMSLSNLAQAADVIVQARCLASTSRWDNGAIWTFAQFAVIEAIKGTPQHQITVRVPGGRVDNLVAKVEAAPQFKPGDETILFLEKKGAADYAVTAWSEGTFRIHTTQSGRPTVTQDSSRTPVFDQVTKQFSAEGVHEMPLDQFYQRLSAAMIQPTPGAAR